PERLRAVLFSIGRLEFADDLLDAGIDVGAVKGRYAGFGRGDQVGDRGALVDGAMAAGQLPAAANDARDLIAWPQGEMLHGSSLGLVEWNRRRLGMAEAPLALATDVQPARAVGIGAGDLGIARYPVMRMGFALLGGKQRQHRGQRIDGKALARRQIKHLALELEIVA